MVIKSKYNIQQDKYSYEDEPTRVINASSEAVTDKNEFYTVSECINKYLTYLSIDPNEELKTIEMDGTTFTKNPFAVSVGITNEDEKRKAILAFLDKDFIKNNNITTNNLYNFVENTTTQMDFTALKMNLLEGEKVNTYSIYGRIVELETNKLIRYQYFIVSIDNYNETFTIEPIDINKYKDIGEIELKTRYDNIEKNERNLLRYINIQDSDVIKKYFDNYQYNMQYDSESAYNLLDKDYREKRFGTIDDYKKYIQDNKQSIINISIDKYQKTDEYGYTRYVCIDKNGNYYIINETAVMQYSLVLDTYTIDIPEFLAKYNSANAQGKVVLNIQKFVDSINSKDYKYAYSKLDSGFRNNYFPTLQSFETYMKNNFYEDNKVEYGKCDEVAGLYTYNVDFIGVDGENVTPMKKTFIVKLGEGTDFTLSFNVN